MPKKTVNPAVKEESSIKKIGAKKSPAIARPVKNRSFPIVGIGGSAGAFSAFESFFRHMPNDSGMAFIIVLHLDPRHKGHIAEVIQNYTSMPVIEAADGMKVECDKIYVIPPNADMGMHNRKLLLLTPAQPQGYRQPIDYFLQSLAEDQWNKAVSIIFSGMGSDGETGVRMIKEKLGMAMVQDPQTAQYNSMPLASIGTNMVDYVLTPEEMPVKLIQYINHPILANEDTEQARNDIQNGNSIQKILMLLRSHTGHDFALYKKSTITRRIDRRVAFHQLPDYVQYVNFLREHPQEIDLLFSELLIGVTKFFRDADAFRSLKDKLFYLFKDKKNDEPIRVWIAGCSTGEEAYSVAMLLIESVDTLAQYKTPKIQIFATDLDHEAIEHARAGLYHGNIVTDVSPERLERFFIKKESHYSVKKELREMIVFAQHNLIKDAPFTRLDLLCCRNVMIYLTSELQKKILPVFHYSLKPNGILFMGPAETIGGFTDMFSAIHPKWKLFERKQGSFPFGKIIDFPFQISRLSGNMVKAEDVEKSAGKKSMADTFNKILLENYTPSSILVNDKGDILYINGKTGRYLELPTGQADMNMYKMVREELRYVLGNMVHQARAQATPVSINDIKLKEAGGEIRLVSLRAEKLDEPGMYGLILIVFEDKGLYKKQKRRVSRDGENDSSHAVDELEKELMYTKQQLHTTIEQMETSLEELKSTNEELQSTNEELQSTNEESLTTKEEMQSLNEELMTINVQYQAKGEELSQLNNDMKNLLDATEIGTIFLDNNLEILRFTPQVRKLFNLIPTDVGRPIAHIVSNIDYPSLENEIKEVLEKLTTKELEATTKAGEWYNVRIMPYRTLDNFISGAVLTFTLITPYKQMEFRLKELQKYSAGIVNVMKDAALQLDKNMCVITVNKRYLEIFHIHDEDIKGMVFSDVVHKQWKTKKLDHLLQKCLIKEVTAIVKVDTGEANIKEFTVNTRPFIDDETKETLMVLVFISLNA
jgi:two-component system CheB/CheR fusion protein